MLTPPTAFPICTIANTPRLPEHCIEWASVLEWPKVFPGERAHRRPRLTRPTRDKKLDGASVDPLLTPRPDKKLDTDDPDHIEWLYQKAAARADEFKIEGVTWTLTQGVVKNIIPAIASTNAIIAGERDGLASLTSASCCNEAFKIATTCAPFLSNYMMVRRAGVSR